LRIAVRGEAAYAGIVPAAVWSCTCCIAIVGSSSGTSGGCGFPNSVCANAPPNAAVPAAAAAAVPKNIFRATRGSVDCVGSISFTAYSLCKKGVFMNRASFLSSASAVAVAASSADAATAVPGGSNFVDRRANFDAASFVRAVNKPADIRQVWEAVAFHPPLFTNMKNGLNGLHFGFGYPADRVTMVFAPHGPSSAFTYTDYVWQKYRIGEFFGLKDASGKIIDSNIYLRPASA